MRRILLAACSVAVTLALLVLPGCPRGGAPAVESTPSVDSAVTTTLAPTATTTTATKTTAATTTTATTTSRIPTTTTTTAAPRAPQTRATAPTPPTVDGAGLRKIKAPLLSQVPAFPTGCESISAVMALQYLGYPVSADDFVDNCLVKSNRFYTQNGVYYGPDPYKVFVGTPRSDNSFGCMAPVIEAAINRYLGFSGVVNRTGTDLPTLCRDYIDKGYPVLIWVTIGMIECYDSASWTLEDGSVYHWPANEHCTLLVGYDANRYYLNDPYRGKYLSYPRSLVENRYQRLGKQALVVTG